MSGRMGRPRRSNCCGCSGWSAAWLPWLHERPCWLPRALLLLADHLIHLVAEKVTLFSHLDDQLSDLVVEFVSGAGVLLGFLIPIVSNFTVLGRFLVNHFASFIEKIFEFCHASSHLVWGGFPSSRILATHLPHLILHGRLVRCFPRHHAGHWSSLMVRRTRPRLERRSHFTAKVRGETGGENEVPVFHDQCGCGVVGR